MTVKSIYCFNQLFSTKSLRTDFPSPGSSRKSAIPSGISRPSRIPPPTGVLSSAGKGASQIWPFSVRGLNDVMGFKCGSLGDHIEGYRHGDGHYFSWHTFIIAYILKLVDIWHSIYQVWPPHSISKPLTRDFKLISDIVASSVIFRVTSQISVLEIERSCPTDELLKIGWSADRAKWICLRRTDKSNRQFESRRRGRWDSGERREKFVNLVIKIVYFHYFWTFKPENFE